MGKRKSGVIIERRNKMEYKLVEEQVPRWCRSGKYRSEHSGPRDQFLRFQIILLLMRSHWRGSKKVVTRSVLENTLFRKRTVIMVWKTDCRVWNKEPIFFLLYYLSLSFYFESGKTSQDVPEPNCLTWNKRHLEVNKTILHFFQWKTFGHRFP